MKICKIGYLIIASTVHHRGMIENQILLMIYGVVALFFWFCAHMLAKDRARKGKSMTAATVFSMLFVLGMTVLTGVLLALLVGYRFDLSEILGSSGTYAASVVLALVEDWKLPVSLFGMLVSAWLGAYFGVVHYRETDRYRVE